VGGAALALTEPGALIDETTVQPTVSELLSRPARSFESWARAHAGAFAS
jgi:hypothetical protein